MIRHLFLALPVRLLGAGRGTIPSIRTGRCEASATHAASRPLGAVVQPVMRVTGRRGLVMRPPGNEAAGIRTVAGAVGGEVHYARRAVADNTLQTGANAPTEFVGCAEDATLSRETVGSLGMVIALAGLGETGI